ncbi:MAG: FxLYD domain-containing protein [Alphaproteobacteria bacterium]
MKQRWLILALGLLFATPAVADQPLPREATHKARPQASLLLELADWSCHWNNRLSVTVAGTVKNISARSKLGVEARIVVLDNKGDVIKGADKPLEDSPLDPNQISHFSGEITLNSSAVRPDSCSIDFVDRDGTYLDWRPSP